MASSVLGAATGPGQLLLADSQMLDVNQIVDKLQAVTELVDKLTKDLEVVSLLPKGKWRSLFDEPSIL